ncbi:MAG: MFS transporter [Eubacterium sp.]
MKEKKVKLWTKDFVLIIIINFLVFLNHLMILATFPFFVSALGYSESVAGACVVCFTLLSVVSRPFVGWLLDNGKRRAILLIGIAGMLLMPVGYLFSYYVVSSIALAIVFRMGHGLALAFSNTSTATIATDVLPKQRFAEGMGMFGMATALATAVAPAFGEALMKKGFNVLFLFAAAIMLIALLMCFSLKAPKPDICAKAFKPTDLLDRNALPASATALIFLLTYGTLENYILKYASSASQITVNGGIYFTLMAVVLFLTRITIGKASDKKGEAIFVYTCNIAMLVALLLLSIIPNNITFIISALLSGYAFGGIEPALQAMAVSIALPEKRGSANSTFLCAYDIGIGLGGGIAGVLIDSIGYNRMFGIVATANILSIIVYICIGKNHPSSITYRIKNEASQ